MKEEDFEKDLKELVMDESDYTPNVETEKKSIKEDLASEKNYSVAQTSHTIHKTDKITKLNFKELADKVEKFVPNTRQALKISLAVAASGTKKGTPMLWILLVGSPSSGKTEIATLIKKSIHVYSVDNLTMSAFITGEREKKDNKVHDLLPELHKKCFLIKDWTTLFSLYEDMTSKIIGDLVNIYDEEYTKFSATRGNITYTSNFSHIGCITPATLNKHTRYLNMIGARFLFYIIPSLTQEQHKSSFRSIFNNTNRRKTKKQLTLLVSKFLNKLSNTSTKNIKPLTKEVEYYLQISAEFIAKARGMVIIQASKFKNDEKKWVTYYEPLDIQIEEPWRAVQQLIRLSKYLALVEERNEVGIEEMEIIKDITLSSMPADRAGALSVFKTLENGEITASQLATVSEKSKATARRLLDELVFLGILEKDRGIGTIANAYKLKEEFKDYVTLSSTLFMQRYSNSVEAGENDIVKIAEEIFT